MKKAKPSTKRAVVSGGVQSRGQLAKSAETGSEKETSNATTANEESKPVSTDIVSKAETKPTNTDVSNTTVVEAVVYSIDKEETKAEVAEKVTPTPKAVRRTVSLTKTKKDVKSSTSVRLTQGDKIILNNIRSILDSNTHKYVSESDVIRATLFACKDLSEEQLVNAFKESI